MRAHPATCRARPDTAPPGPRPLARPPGCHHGPMTYARTEADLTGPPLSIGQTLRVLAWPVVSAAVSSILLTALVVGVVGLVRGFDDPWLLWGIASGLLTLLAITELFPKLNGRDGGTLSRAGVWVALVVLMALCAVAAGAASMGVRTLGAPPLASWDAWWVPGVLVFACGLWVCCCLMALVTLWSLPVVVGVALGIGMVLVAMLGVMAPGLLPVWGGDTASRWVLASPVVTLPALGALMGVMPMGRLTQIKSSPWG